MVGSEQELFTVFLITKSQLSTEVDTEKLLLVASSSVMPVKDGSIVTEFVNIPPPAGNLLIVPTTVNVDIVFPSIFNVDVKGFVNPVVIVTPLGKPVAVLFGFELLLNVMLLTVKSPEGLISTLLPSPSFITSDNNILVAGPTVAL